MSIYTNPLAGSQVLGQQPIAILKAANLQSTADQAFTIVVQSGIKFVVRRLVAYNGTGSIVLAAGGVYTGAGGTGTAVVAAAQLYAGAAGSSFLDLTLNGPMSTTPITLTTLFLKLGVANAAAATCDIVLYGDLLP